MTPSAPAAKKSAEEQLFERKLKMARELSCKTLFEDLAAVDATAMAKLGERVDLQSHFNATKASFEDAKTIAGLNIEGKNEAERTARKVEALKSDPQYQMLQMSLRAAENALQLLDNEIEELKRRSRRIEREIAYKTGVLEFLKS